MIKPDRSFATNKIMFKLERKDSYEWFMGRAWPGQWKTFNDPDFNWQSYSSAAAYLAGHCMPMTLIFREGGTGVWKNRHVSMVRNLVDLAQTNRFRRFRLRISKGNTWMIWMNKLRKEIILFGNFPIDLFVFGNLNLQFCWNIIF